MRPIQIGFTVSLIFNLTFSNQTRSSEVKVREQAPKAQGSSKMFRAGAHAVDIAPRVFPVFINGGFLQNQAIKLNDPIHAKALVLDDGSLRLAIVVVDSCMMPRELIDRAKELARQKTGIPADRILISATHTHYRSSGDGRPGLPCR